MIRSHWLCGLLLLPMTCSLALGQEPTSAALRGGVLLGMKLEAVTAGNGDTRVVTTGADFLLERSGRIRGFQRMPQRREVAQFVFPPGTPPLKLQQRNDFAATLTPHSTASRREDDT